MGNRMTTLEDEEKLLDFVRLVAEHFSDHPETATYGELGGGNFFALRWGMGEDCVVVLKQDEDWKPVNFQNIIKKEGKS